jgi:uncharacterized protein YecE (DUF72 family)
VVCKGFLWSCIDWWAKRLKRWHAGREPPDAARLGPKRSAGRGRDVYVYFDNDAKKHAPFDAARLSQRLGLPSRHEPGAPLGG